MRHWSRSASQLGNTALEDSIEQELTRRFPLGQFPVNIDVVGAQSTECPTVQITNFEGGIKIFEKVVPQVGWNTEEAVIAAAERVILELAKSGKLPQP